jgi:hypothetical protein
MLERLQCRSILVSPFVGCDTVSVGDSLTTLYSWCLGEQKSRALYLIKFIKIWWK